MFPISLDCYQTVWKNLEKNSVLYLVKPLKNEKKTRQSHSQYVRTCEWMNKSMNEWMNEQMNERMKNEWMNKWLSKWMKELMVERMIERMNEWNWMWEGIGDNRNEKRCQN